MTTRVNHECAFIRKKDLPFHLDFQVVQILQKALGHPVNISRKYVKVSSADWTRMYFIICFFKEYFQSNKILLPKPRTIMKIHALKMLFFKKKSKQKIKRFRTPVLSRSCFSV